MQEYRNESGPHLIVVPKSTLSNWMNEIARWAPELTAVKFHGDKATREAIVQQQLEPAQKDEDRQWNVLVTTYEVCNIEKNVLKKFAWSYLIIDEVRADEQKHRPSCPETSVSNCVQPTRRRIVSKTKHQPSLKRFGALKPNFVYS